MDCLYEQIEYLKQKEKIIFTGYVPAEELPALYQVAEVLASPSSNNGLGLLVLEAMVCGTPVVCSNNSSLPEVVGEAALLVPPDNHEQLAQGLKRVLKSENLQNQMCEKGLSWASLFS